MHWKAGLALKGRFGGIGVLSFARESSKNYSLISEMFMTEGNQRDKI